MGGRHQDCETTGTATNDGYPEHSFTWDVTLRIRDALQQMVRAPSCRVTTTMLSGLVSTSALPWPMLCIRMR
jgi:N-acetylmuramoyl-L-alanine amidase